MKKILITAVALILAVPALAAQQDIAQLSAVTASREALRTAINTQLSAVQSNFDEIYAVIDAGPVYANTTAPADTKVVWIDTDQDSAIKVYVGGAWTVVGSGGGTGIAHATSDGNYYASKDGGWASLAGVFLNPSGSADLLTITDTGTYFTTDTVGAALQELGGAPELLFGTEFIETAGTGTVTLTLDFPVTSEVYGAGWAADTEGAQRDDIYAILHVGDTDDDGMADKLDLAASGVVKTDASGVISTATAGTDYLTPTNLATGSTDNAILRANGTGGSTAQASGVTIDDNDNVTVPGAIKGRTLFNSYATDQTLTAATHNSTVVQMTAAGEITMWDCETANVGDQVILWARDAEKIEVVPASGDHFALFNGTALTADYELDVPATAGTKVTLLCTADDTWSVFHETATTTDGGAVD